MGDIIKSLGEVEKDLSLVDSGMEEWNIDYFKMHKKRYISELKIIEKYYNGGKLLEVGSIPCHLTYCFKKMDYPVTGVDIEPKRAERFIKKTQSKC
ncbi:MAG: hypothetical protein R6U32_07155 [Candidatus Woesearchaeota archaeon]